MYSKDAAIRAGQSLQIEVSNKPYVDMSIPPEANDYRWADCARIQIFDTEDNILVDTEMCPITSRPGWYTYRFQTLETMQMGVYRVIVRLFTGINPPSPSGSPAPSGCPGDGVTCATTGSSGCPIPGQPLSDVKVSYFRIMDLY